MYAQSPHAICAKCAVTAHRRGRLVDLGGVRALRRSGGSARRMGYKSHIRPLGPYLRLAGP